VVADPHIARRTQHLRRRGIRPLDAVHQIAGPAGKLIPGSLYRPDSPEEIAAVQQAARDDKPH